MSGSAMKTLQVFKKICGHEAFPHIALASTMWSVLENCPDGETLGCSRMQTLLEKYEFWGAMFKGGSAVFQHTGDAASARRIVGSLLQKYDSSGTSVVLDLQKEMVDMQKALDATSAGQFLQKELQEEVKKHQKVLTELDEELKEAILEEDEKLVSDLSEQRRDYEARIELRIAEGQKMRVRFKQSHASREQDEEPDLASNSRKGSGISESGLQAQKMEIENLRQQVQASKAQRNDGPGLLNTRQNQHRTPALERQHLAASQTALQEQHAMQRQYLERRVEQEENEIRRMKRKEKSWSSKLDYFGRRISHFM